MNQSMIVKPYLDNARRQVFNANESLYDFGGRGSDDALAAQDQSRATDALATAIVQVALAVERLAELVVD